MDVFLFPGISNYQFMVNIWSKSKILKVINIFNLIFNSISQGLYRARKDYIITSDLVVSQGCDIDRSNHRKGSKLNPLLTRYCVKCLTCLYSNAIMWRVFLVVHIYLSKILLRNGHPLVKYKGCKDHDSVKRTTGKNN